MQAEAEDEPLHISAVHIPDDVHQQLCSAWARVKRSLYESSDAFVELVHQVGRLVCLCVQIWNLVDRRWCNFIKQSSSSAGIILTSAFDPPAE